jgi:hypothetical protein
MTNELLAETIDELVAACLELPWLDEARLERGQATTVTIIPSDDVAAEEKLLVTIEAASPLSHRLPTLVREIEVELGAEQPITAIVHGGGAQYTFLQADDRTLSIPADGLSATSFLRVLFLLKEISVTAHALLLVNAKS